jgi:hypothetical protein
MPAQDARDTLEFTEASIPSQLAPELLIPVAVPVMIINVVIINVVIAVVIVAVSGPAYYDGNGFRIRGNQSEQS